MSEKRYYFDTSIWLDFLEKRDEPNMPKSDWALKLVDKVTNNGDTIILSDNNILELESIGYLRYDIEDLLSSLSSFIKYVESTSQQIGKAKDLSQKRNVPKRDALHALIARDNQAILVTLDSHFNELKDICKPYRTNELI